MNKIQRNSRRIRLALQGFFYLAPLMLIHYWSVLDTAYDIYNFAGLITPINHLSLLMEPITTTTRILAFVASLLPVGIIMLGLHLLIGLFKHYEQGNIFTLENSKTYQRLGYCLLFWVLGNVLYGALLSVVLSSNGNQENRALILTLTGPDLLPLILAAIIIVISQIMSEGQKIADENSQTI
jgi:hypothetical protein